VGAEARGAGIRQGLEQQDPTGQGTSPRLFGFEHDEGEAGTAQPVELVQGQQLHLVVLAISLWYRRTRCSQADQARGSRLPSWFSRCVWNDNCAVRSFKAGTLRLAVDLLLGAADCLLRNAWSVRNWCRHVSRTRRLTHTRGDGEMSPVYPDW